MNSSDGWKKVLGRTPNVSQRVSLSLDMWRFRLLWLATAMVFIVIIVRAFHVQIIQHRDLQEKIDRMVLRTEVIHAQRGMVTDRNGVPLAISTPIMTIWMDVKEYFAVLQEQINIQKQLQLNPQNSALKNKLVKTQLDLKSLAAQLGISESELQQKLLQHAKSRYYPLKRQVPPAEARGIIAQKFQSVYQEPGYKRFYPQAQTHAHLVGITNRDSRGIEGIEAVWNAQLAGQDGQKRVMRDKRGNRIKDVSLLKADTQGQNVALSIDSRIQYIMYREIAATGVAANARSVSAMAVDVDTGEVLAMTSWPSYNPNSINSVTNSEVMRNRPVVDIFEPGSTMKPFTVAAALESGQYTTHSVIQTSPGRMKIGRFTISDHENYGAIPIGDVIVKSSNVGAAKIALSLPKTTLPNFFRRLGLGKKTGLGFPGEASGLMRSNERINTSELATMAYGYGLSISLAQMVQAYSILAANGVYRPISLIKHTEPETGKQLLDPKIAQAVVHMMEGVVSDRGTAILASVPGYRVAGKTGTAHKLRADGKGYSANEYRGLFVGMAPASKPKVVLAIVVENPQGAYYGGLVAAPAFSRIMQETLRILSVPLDKPF